MRAIHMSRQKWRKTFGYLQFVIYSVCARVWCCCSFFPFSFLSRLNREKSMFFSHRHRPNTKWMYSVWSMVMWQNEIKLSCKFVTMNLHQIYIRLVVNVYFIRIRIHHRFEWIESRVSVPLNVKGYRNCCCQHCNLIESK